MSEQCPLFPWHNSVDDVEKKEYRRIRLPPLLLSSKVLVASAQPRRVLRLNEISTLPILSCQSQIQNRFPVTKIGDERSDWNWT